MSKLYGLDMVQTPYNAVPLLMQDLSSGRTDMTMLAAGPLMPFVNSGKLRALAVAGPSRVAIAPMCRRSPSPATPSTSRLLHGARGPGRHAACGGEQDFG